MFQKIVVEKIKTNFFVFSNFFENRAVYEIMWKNIVEGGRPQLTIWHMRIACWIPNATNIHTHFMWYSLIFHCSNGCKTRLNVTLYAHCRSCPHCDEIMPSSSQQYVCRRCLHLLFNRSAVSLTCNSPPSWLILSTFWASSLSSSTRSSRVSII
jgi:uncharacterized paraquat-inducible protein A